MAYEIPQELEYKEKIMFGLTFRQLGYLFIFAPVILIIFFKTPFILTFKIIISSIISVFAIGLMFFKFEEIINNWIGWMKLREIRQIKQEIKERIPEKKELKPKKPSKIKKFILSAYQKFIKIFDRITRPLIKPIKKIAREIDLFFHFITLLVGILALPFFLFFRWIIRKIVRFIKWIAKKIFCLVKRIINWINKLMPFGQLH